MRKLLLLCLTLATISSSCASDTPNNQTINKEKTKKETRNGYYEQKYPNGNLWSTCNYKNGKKHGKVASYYPNGQIRYVGFFKDDKKTDIWLFYNENGKFAKEVDFRKNNN